MLTGVDPRFRILANRRLVMPREGSAGCEEVAGSLTAPSPSLSTHTSGVCQGGGEPGALPQFLIEGSACASRDPAGKSRARQRKTMFLLNGTLMFASRSLMEGTLGDPASLVLEGSSLAAAKF